VTDALTYPQAQAMATPATTRFTLDLPRRLRSAVPDVPIDDRQQDRGRRDRVVDATMYLFASLGAVALADTWSVHPVWSRIPDLAIGLAAVAALRWRRSHPGAVGLLTAAASIVTIAASGAVLVATFNAAIRARSRDLVLIAALSIASNSALVCDCGCALAVIGSPDHLDDARAHGLHVYSVRRPRARTSPPNAALHPGHHRLEGTAAHQKRSDPHPTAPTTGRRRTLTIRHPHVTEESWSQADVRAP